MSKTIHLRGSTANYFMAEELVRIYGAEGARSRCTGEMLDAVNGVIERRKTTTLAAFDKIEHAEKRERAELRSSVERAARNRI